MEAEDATRAEACEAAPAPPRPTAPCWTQVDLHALRHNVRALRSLAPPENKLIAVVKADAYGHGAAPVSRAALEAGAWGLGVARVGEGLELRRAGIRAPVLVFGYTPEEELPVALANDLAVTVSGWRCALALSSLGTGTGRTARVHLKVDTGMRRFGVEAASVARFAEALRELPGVYLEGLYTHFATADEPESAAYAEQLRAFDSLVRALRERGLLPPLVHAANSAAAAGPAPPLYDAQRPGIGLYGIQPSGASKLDLRPAMSVKARVGRVLDVHRCDGVSYGHDYLAVTDHRAAVVTCGYADGYMRSLGGVGELLIGGRRCRVLGRVTMDSVIVGLPEGLGATEGEEAVLLGAQGAEFVGAEELAARAGTIAYELLCGFGRRPERLTLG